ncbi:hypothetical protein AB1Y20_021933 [Prymnesium parvum]|uniref:DNA-directed DNA polymerase n=1 Tax=Prymnesium parvum TaxID=97485 RepID=A0AB34JHA1_PRYPA
MIHPLAACPPSPPASPPHEFTQTQPTSDANQQSFNDASCIYSDRAHFYLQIRLEHDARIPRPLRRGLIVDWGTHNNHTPELPCIRTVLTGERRPNDVEDYYLTDDTQNLARILDLCKARLRYEFPGRDTLGKHLMLLGQEGKTLGRDFLLRLIKSGVKPSITGDLWSESGMGRFGIYAHGITETWAMEKALIGLVACSAERHTAVNIKKWTEEALTAIGFNSKELLEPA